MFSKICLFIYGSTVKTLISVKLWLHDVHTILQHSPPTLSSHPLLPHSPPTLSSHALTIGLHDWQASNLKLRVWTWSNLLSSPLSMRCVDPICCSLHIAADYNKLTHLPIKNRASQHCSSSWWGDICVWCSLYIVTDYNRSIHLPSNNGQSTWDGTSGHHWVTLSESW